MNYFAKDFYLGEFFKSPHFNGKFYHEPFFAGWHWARPAGTALASAGVVTVSYDKTIVGAHPPSHTFVWVNGVEASITAVGYTGSELAIDFTPDAKAGDTVVVEVTPYVSSNISATGKITVPNTLAAKAPTKRRAKVTTEDT